MIFSHPDYVKYALDLLFVNWGELGMAIARKAK